MDIEALDLAPFPSLSSDPFILGGTGGYWGVATRCTAVEDSIGYTAANAHIPPLHPPSRSPLVRRFQRPPKFNPQFALNPIP